MPSLNLVSMCHHFIDRLTIPELEVLRKIATGLDGKTVPVGSTCSGFATTGPCVKALFHAINERFNTSMQSSCEFAVEIDPLKQQFILDAHGTEVRHVFSDVSCFQNKQAYCLREKQEVEIPKVFLLVSSPSCKFLSGQRTDRAKYASAYETGDAEASDESGHTYEFGYKRAIQTTEAEVSIFENVRDAASRLKNKKGVPQTPAVEVIEKDRGFQKTNKSFKTFYICKNRFFHVKQYI